MNPTWFRRLCHLVALAAEAALGDPDNPIPTAYAFPETSCCEPLPGPHDARPADSPRGRRAGTPAPWQARGRPL